MSDYREYKLTMRSTEGYRSRMIVHAHSIAEAASATTPDGYRTVKVEEL